MVVVLGRDSRPSAPGTLPALCLLLTLWQIWLASSTSQSSSEASHRIAFTGSAILSTGMHVAVAWLAAKQQCATAGGLACINWVFKACSTWNGVRCWGGTPTWQARYSDSSFYLTSICGACLDYYQLKLGQQLHPYLITLMNASLATLLSLCVERSKYKLGLPTHGLATTWALLSCGTVAGPRIADALLRWLTRRNPAHVPTLFTAPMSAMPAVARAGGIGTVVAVAAAPAGPEGKHTVQEEGGNSGKLDPNKLMHDAVQPAGIAGYDSASYDSTVTDGSGLPLCYSSACSSSPATHKVADAAAITAAAGQGGSDTTDAMASIAMSSSDAKSISVKDMAEGPPPLARHGELAAVQSYHAIKAAAERITAQTYTSPLGVRTKVTVKVKTSRPLAEVPADLAVHLHAALSNIHPKHLLLDIAARPGCVMLNLDLLQLPPDAANSMSRSSSNSSNGSSSSEHGPAADTSSPQQQAHSLAQALLPALLPLLPVNRSSSDSSTSSMVFSVGNVTLAAVFEPETGSWLLQPVEDSAANTLKSAAADGTGEEDSLGWQLAVLHAQWHCSPTSTPTQALAGIHRPVTIDQQYHQHVIHSAVLQLKALQVTLADVACSEENVLICGWSAASAGMHEMDMPASRLKLLARAEGSYLATRVQGVTPASLAGSSNSSSHDDGASAASPFLVEVQVPDMLLPRHHAEGPPVGLLPVVLELWQGVRCVSSTPVLLHTTPAVTSAWPAEQVWWWGTSGRAAQLASYELQAISVELQRAAVQNEQASLLQSWHAFTTDLHTWLAHIREVCPSSPNGCLSTTPTRILPATCLGQPPLNPKALLQLGTHLTEYAHAALLTHTKLMLAQQSAVAQAWALQAAASCCSPTSAMAGMGRLFRASLQGYTCTRCEARCRASMSQQLAGAQVYSSLMIAGLGASSLLRNGNKPNFDWAWVPSMAVHSVVWLSGFHVFGMSALANRGGGTLALLAYAFRMVPMLLYAVGAKPLGPGFLMLFKTRAVLAHALVLALGEQLQVALQLGFSGALLAVGVLEVVFNTCIAARVGVLDTFMLVGLLLSCTLSSILMDMRMRAVITRTWAGPTHAAARSVTRTAAGNRHGSHWSSGAAGKPMHAAQHG